MNISYKKLWKLLIDKELTVADIRAKTGVAASTFSKMRKNEYVSLNILVRLCIALDCQLSDIVEVVLERPDENMMPRGSNA